MTLDLSAVDLPIVSSPEAEPFCRGIERGDLVLPSCAVCGPFWYPRNLSPACGTRQLTWLEPSGRGVLPAFCIHHPRALTHLNPLLPVATVLVDPEVGVRKRAG